MNEVVYVCCVETTSKFTYCRIEEQAVISLARLDGIKSKAEVVSSVVNRRIWPSINTLIYW